MNITNKNNGDRDSNSTSMKIPFINNAFAGNIIKPFQEFFKTEAKGGILLFVAALLAMVMANTSAREFYHQIWETPLTFALGGLRIESSFQHLINEGLMTIFFFLVGLEIKRELLVGELSTTKKAMLPVIAAAGGMVVPALIYTSMNLGGPGQHGWAIPMATDIAFALGCLALLGRGLPAQLVIFLTALAIIDDIAAILVIAAFYTDQISMPALASVVALVGAAFVMNKMSVHRTLPYVIVGIALWFAMLKSGVHVTLSGVLMAMTIPATTTIGNSAFALTIREQLSFFTGEKKDARADHIDLDYERKQMIIQKMERACHDIEAPLQRIEHYLHPWVVYLIMPLFAFANAGVEISLGALGRLTTDPVFLGVIFGLVLGKQIGVFGFSWLSVRAGFTALPRGVGWGHIYGVSVVAGIGFTMSLFIGMLAFDSDGLLESAKIGILVASFISGLFGFWVLKRVMNRERLKAEAMDT